MEKPKTAKEALDILDDFFSDLHGISVEEREGLWDVLTALRGPDSCDAVLKSISTSHIRALAFPRTRLVSGLANVASFTQNGNDTTIPQRLVVSGAMSPWHFIDHIGFAELVLNRIGRVSHVEKS